MLSQRQVSPYFLLVLLVALAWVSFRVLGVFLSYILFGLFLAYLTHPLYRRLLRGVKNGPTAAMLMLLAMVVVVLVPLGFLVARLVEEIQAVVAKLGPADPQAILDTLSLRINEFFGLPPPEPGTRSGLVNDIYDSLQDNLTLFARELPSHIAEGIIGVFVLIYVLYYSYTDGERVLAALRETLPMQPGHRDILFREVGHVIRGVMYGTILMSLVQAVLAGIGFAIFGVSNVVFWAVITFILALLPIVGAPMVWVPWGLYLIYIGENFRGVGLLLYSAILVNGIEHIIRPKLIGTVADIHPVIVLLGVLGGLVVFGFIGFILGPLVLSVFVTLLKLYRREFAPKVNEPPTFTGT